MYTRDREGYNPIVEDNRQSDSQVSSCTPHILFGHGPQLTDVANLVIISLGQRISEQSEILLLTTSLSQVLLSIPTSNQKFFYPAWQLLKRED